MAATDFQDVANLRMLWTPAAAQADLRSGIELNGQPVVIEFYGKAQGRQEIDTPGIRAGALKIAGFLTRWTTLPSAVPLATVTASRTGSVATLTFAAITARVGQFVEVAGMAGIYAPLNGRYAVTAQTATSISFQTAAAGTITAGAAVGTARLVPTDADWLAAGAVWPWQEGGLRPSGFLPGAVGPALWGDLSILPARIAAERGQLTMLELGGKFGAGGIGAEIRAEVGDGFVAGFASIA